MKKLCCGDCEHWERADNIAAPINDSVPGKEPGRAGWCYAKPPSAMLGQAPNALGAPRYCVPQMQVTAIRPPVEDTETACGSFELSSELAAPNTPIDA